MIRCTPSYGQRVKHAIGFFVCVVIASQGQVRAQSQTRTQSQARTQPQLQTQHQFQTQSRFEAQGQFQSQNQFQNQSQFQTQNQYQTQDPRVAKARQMARAKMQSMDAPSLVDRYRKPQQFQQQQPRFAASQSRQQFQPRQSADRFRETAFNQPGAAQVRPSSDFVNARDANVRQVAMLQDTGAPPFPLDGVNVGGSIPGSPLPGVAPGPSVGLNPNALPGNVGISGSAPLQPVPDPNASVPIVGNSDLRNRALPLNNGGPIRSPSDIRGADLRPMPQPQLQNGGFATLNNCNCVSGPSGYSAASGFGCGSTLGHVSQANAVGPLPSGYVAPPAQVPAPAAIPVNPGFVAPGAGLGQGGLGAGIGNGSPPRALVSLGQQLNPVQVGQGLWGQPVAYVPGQTVRNWVRYFFP